MSPALQAAPIRTIHSERKSRFLRRRPTNPYRNAFSTASCAARFSLLFVRKYPDALASVLWRYALRLVPRFTLGTFYSWLKLSGLIYPDLVNPAGKVRASTHPRGGLWISTSLNRESFASAWLGRSHRPPRHASACVCARASSTSGYAGQTSDGEPPCPSRSS